MTERGQTFTPDETAEVLQESPFRHEGSSLVASFPTGDFATGARLVALIAEDADALNHHPDLTLTYGSVGVELTSHDAGGVTERDLELAQRIDAAATSLGVTAIPGG